MLHANSAGGRVSAKTGQILSNSPGSIDHLCRRRQSVPAIRAHLPVGPSKIRTTSRRLPSLATLVAHSARGPSSIPTPRRLAMMDVACHALSVRRTASSDCAKSWISSQTRCVAVAVLCTSRVKSDIGKLRRRPQSPQIASHAMCKDMPRGVQKAKHTLSVFRNSFTRHLCKLGFVPVPACYACML